MREFKEVSKSMPKMPKFLNTAEDAKIAEKTHKSIKNNKRTVVFLGEKIQPSPLFEDEKCELIFYRFFILVALCVLCVFVVKNAKS